MNPIIKSILVMVLAIVTGSIVNMAFIYLGPMVIPNPAGTDLTTEVGLTAAMPLMQPKHFIFPFLAHALGTLSGSYIAVRFSDNRKLIKALIIGVVFLIGGIQMVMILPSPLWFNLIDLTVAYVPFSLLGYLMAGGKNNHV